MKTRRILAASTAALLAFGTTAAYVVSAAELTVTVSVPEGTTAASDAADADVTKLVTVKDADNNDVTAKFDLTVARDTTDKIFIVTAALKSGETDTLAASGNKLSVDFPFTMDNPVNRINRSDYTITVTQKTGTTLKATTDAAEIEAMVTTNVAYRVVGGTPNVALDKVTAAVTEVKANGEKFTATVKLTNADDPEDTPDVRVDVTPAVADNTSDTNTSKPAATEPKTLNKIEEDKAVSIGGGVKITLSEKDVEKFEEEKYEKYNLTATAEDVEDVKDGDKLYVRTDDNANSAVKGLDKALKKEIAKIESKNFKIINIDLADGDYVESTSPVAIKVTVTLDKDYKVYHVSGKTVEKLKSSSRKMTDGKYEISFSTKKFSPFIFTTADLKNAGGTTSDGEPTSAAATSSGSTTNPDTGLALAIAPVVLAAGAVAVVALKKKK